MQLIVEKKGYRLLVLLALAVAAALLMLVARDTEATHNDRLLELDGNAAFNGGRGPNAGDAPCAGAIPTAAPFVTPPAPPDCIQTATPATFDWAAFLAGNGTGVCKAGANDPATTGNETNLIDEDTKPADVITSICVRDFAVGTVDGPALGQGTPSCPSGQACQIGDTADLTYHTGSDKDFQEIWDGSSADWGCTEQSNAVNKGDLLNAYFVRASNAAGDDIFYFGAERASENGSVFNGFWFLQNRVADDCPRNLPFPSGVGDFCSQTTLENATCTAPNQSKHKDKDVLILFNYDNGGRIGSIGAYVWDNAAVASVTPGLACPNGLGTRTPADNLCVVENLDLNTGGDAGDCRARATTNALCGRVNGATDCAPTRSKPEICSGPGAFSTPWAPGCVSGGANCRSPFQLASPTFSEGGVNLTSLGIDLGCVQGFLAESRSSPSVDATLKDYTMGGLDPCGLAWEKRDASVASNPLQGGATFTITPGPFGGASLVVTDCVALPCAAGGDDDPDAGSFNLGDVNPGNYQVCETTAPGGYARDDSLCRNVVVSSDTPNVVIGTQDVDDCTHATADEQDFCNLRGSVAWEKRDSSLTNNPLQGGATFTISPNPDACVDANSDGADDASPVTVVDDTDGTDGPGPDDDGTAGEIVVGPACIATYTITETVAPAGYALPANQTRTCEVTATALNCVVGSQGTDDCQNAVVAEQDFCNRRGSLAWEKRDGSLATNPLQGGATFTVSPNPDACVDANTTGADDVDPLTVVDDTDDADGPGPDDDGTAGEIAVGPACLATYTITETVPPTGYALPANATRTCQVTSAALSCVVGAQGTDDCQNADATERDFCNRLGSIEWEKRDDQGVLQGGATFTVGQGATPADGDGNGPFACHDSDNTGDDDKNPVTVVDNSSPDTDSTLGQLKLERVCMGTYTITETVAPPGFAIDDTPSREITVSPSELNPVVGDQGTNDIGDTDEDDFGNRLGSIQWEKRDDTTALQGGATFTVGGTSGPFACHDTDTDDDSGDEDNPVTVLDNSPPDADPTPGQLKLERVCLGTYTITETVPPPGFALDDDPTRLITVSSAELDPVVGVQDQVDCSDFNTDEQDFCNRLGTIEWEKRDDQGVLQGGATFTVGGTSGPFACHDTDTDDDSGDEDNPVTVVDNSPPDMDATLGQLKLERVCMGTYTITETVAPPGFAIDDTPSREITVSPSELNPVVGDQGTNDIGDTDEDDFGNRLGTIEWEKRDDQGVLQGGATFTVGGTSGPFACHDTDTDDDSGDEDNPVTVLDNSPPDADPDLGQLKLERVCLGTYTITETVPPTGFALDDDPTREITVSSSELNPVVGDQGTNDIGDTDEDDFGNRLGTIEWEKRDDLLALQSGAQFAVTPNPFDCHGGADPGTFTDNAGPDADSTGGQVKLERVCLGSYTVCEMGAPTGFARDDSYCRSVAVTAVALTAVIGEQDTNDCANETADEQDFCNRLGSLAWEKRNDVNGHLLGGATFEVNPNPFACRGDGSDPLVVVDDESDVLPDASEPDEDDDAGQFSLSRVCMGTYTITETVASAGFAADPDNTRLCEVDDPTFAGGSDELDCVVGSALETPPTGEDPPTGNDDCPDADDGVDTEESDFCNLVGSLYWEKRGKDVSTAETGNELLPGFGFTVTGTGVNVVVSDCTSGPCTPGGDQDPDAGKFCLDVMPIGVLLTIDETSKATGYIQTSPENDGDLTKTLSTSSTCSGGASDANDAGVFINQPLSKFEIEFICVAPSPSDPSKCATAAKITCPTPATLPTPDDPTPDAFDDIKEVYGDETTGLLEGTYNCEIVIDP